LETAQEEAHQQEPQHPQQEQEPKEVKKEEEEEEKEKEGGGVDPLLSLTHPATNRAPTHCPKQKHQEAADCSFPPSLLPFLSSAPGLLLYACPFLEPVLLPFLSRCWLADQAHPKC